MQNIRTFKTTHLQISDRWIPFRWKSGYRRPAKPSESENTHRAQFHIEGDFKMPNVLNHHAEQHNGEEMRSDSSLRSLCNGGRFYLIY